MKVACIGNAVYDCTISSDVFIKEDMRNSFDNSTFTAGGPALVAASVIKRFGTDVDFYGKVGNDENGKFIIKELCNDGIDIKNLNVSNEIMTPFSFIIINSSNNTRTICSLRSKSEYDNAKINTNHYDKNYDYILTDGKYAYDTLNLIKNNPNAITIIDAGRPNKNVISLCHVIDYIICSEDFANSVTGLTLNKNLNNMDLVYSKLKKIFPSSKGIAITVGENGYIYEKDGHILNNKPYITEKEVIDTNGAGDIFHGAFTYALSSGYNFFQSLEFANVTATLSTTKKGGKNSCPDLEEVEKIINNDYKYLVKKKQKKS